MITTVAYWKGGNSAEVLATARQSKAAFMKHGAISYHVGRVYAGPDAGLWEIAVTYDSWEAYGKAQQALAADAEYQALHGKVLSMADFTGRRITVGIET